MTYPPSPYGGYPGQNEPGQFGQPQQQPYGQPQQPYGQPQQYIAPQQQYYNAEAQQYYGPQGQWPPMEPPRKKSKRSLVIVLAVVLVVLVASGVSAWAFWPESGRGVQQGPSGAAGGGQSRPKASLHGRSKEDLLKALPGLQDMPTGWREEPQGSGAVGDIAPEECVRVLPKGALKNLINRYYANPDDHYKSGIEAYLFEWTAEPQLDKMKDYVSRCANYTRTVSGGGSAPDTVYNLSVTEVGAPKVPADATFAYEEGGTLTPVEDGQDPALSPDRYYLASLRGVNLIVFCRNSAVTKDKCEEVFVRTTTQLANID
ncbi:MAG: hypothetical protein ACRC20_10975 [Segniliparus sp.]|uniref:hypothetical protein n=1 Tax=Segniliparus sp. TaxID=2804064 RepID=UPI003F2D814E